MTEREMIQSGKTALGIELGSTRIKAVLLGSEHQTLASGAFSWENRLENGRWTYHLEDAVRGLQESFAALRKAVQKQYGVSLSTVGAIGISGMMHGYLPLDRDGRQLAPFLTWRNTNTQQAADRLTELFGFNIPLRWSVAQLYQAILDGAAHVPQISYLTTLAGYIHYLLSGRRVVGIGEASGMFPIDSARLSYHADMLEQFDRLTEDKELAWKLRDILPEVLTAGRPAGTLTPEGARLLDPTGTLRPGILMAPPEGDAGTGMVATDAVEACTGNISAGTSIFAMVVLEKPLRRLYRDIDMVTTPSGSPVAMVHCNNGTSELDIWMQMFAELARLAGSECSMQALYERLFEESLRGAGDCDDILLYNYISAEPVTGVTDGRPVLLRRPDSKLSLGNFMRAQLYSIFASLAVGMRILTDEQVKIKRLTGHGGLFKTPGVAQRYLAAAMDAPVTVLKTAGEGGPYGMAVLASYLQYAEQMSLEAFLKTKVFAGAPCVTVSPDEKEAAGYQAYLKRYCGALAVANQAAACIGQSKNC